MKRLNIEIVKENLEDTLNESAYYWYWEVGRYEFKRTAYGIIKDNEEKEFMIDTFEETLRKNEVRKYQKWYDRIDDNWYKETFKCICIDGLNKAA